MVHQDTFRKDVKDIKDKISRKHPYLHIDRMPLKSFEVFKKLADDDFCSDYGMTLKHLIDFYQGLIPMGNEHLELEIERLKQDVNEVKVNLTSKEKDENKPKKRLDGSSSKT